MHFAINCADDPNTSIDDFGLDQVDPTFRRFLYNDAIRTVIACQILDVPQLPAVSDEPVVSGLPVLLVSGSLDPATDPSFAPIVGAHLANSQSVVIPGAGHGQAQNPCATAIKAAFMASPTAPVDTSCIQQAPPFATPLTVSASSQDGSASMSLALPPGFNVYPNGVDSWFSNELLIALKVYSAGTAPDDALAELAGMAPDAKYADGPEVAGNPSRYFQIEVQGSPIYVIAFANETGTYRVLANVLTPSETDAILGKQVPAILETITFGPGG